MKTRIGTRLLAIREERGMRQIDMAEMLDIPESTYARYERNESQVDYNKLVSFAKKLEIPVQELLPETVSITNNNHNSGQGGGVIFGNQYFYLGDELAKNGLVQENQELKSKVALLEEKIEKLLQQFSSTGK